MKIPDIPELLHCPFCGGRAEFVIISIKMQNHNAVAVRCSTCGASSEQLPYEYKEKEFLSVAWDRISTRQKQAAEMWNKRYKITEG